MHDPFYPKMGSTLAEGCRIIGQGIPGTKVVIVALHLGQNIQVAISANQRVANLPDMIGKLFEAVIDGKYKIREHEAPKKIAAATDAQYVLMVRLAAEGFEVLDNGAGNDEIKAAILFGISTELQKFN